ncbi:Putative protein-glutamate O-methyltransferase [Gryllus bimaculatus]|nr:Putative protein-glutamate O-methyltransferase [Gryllus bimaculatus]
MSNDPNESEMPYDSCEDIGTPLNVQLCAKYKRSFAYVTMKDRLPIILTQVIDHMSREKENIVNEYGKEALEELKIAIGKISKLKNELQTNKPLILLEGNASDVTIWNAFLKQLKDEEGNDPRWFHSAWLATECYMYRRLREAFELTDTLTSFDPFRSKKQAALLDSLGTINVLCTYVKRLVEQQNCHCSTDIKNEFMKLLYVDLWGNRCDLSLSGGEKVLMEEDPLQKIGQLSEYILIDEAEKVWNTLAVNREKSDVIVDMVLDNAGYELYTDLCLADLLVTFSLASQVRFRAKVLPWYVSDVCIPDFQWALQILSNSENSEVSALANRWLGHMKSGKWVLCADEFWTLPHVFNQMQNVDPTLYQELSNAVLMIIKGDLNYRKLTGDINWEPTKPFSEALSEFRPTNIAALRTLKADTICGLLAGQAEDTAAKSSEWLISGQYAVVQYSSL